MIRISLPSPLFLSLSLSLYLPFHPLLFPICTSVLSSIQPTLYVLIPLHTDQFVHLCCFGAAQVTDSRVTDKLLLHKLQVLTPTYKDPYETHKETADLWLVSVDCGANYTLFNRPSVEADTYRDGDWWCVHVCVMGGQWNMDSRHANPLTDSAFCYLTYYTCMEHTPACWNASCATSYFEHACILNCACMFLESLLHSKLAVKYFPHSFLSIML